MSFEPAHSNFIGGSNAAARIACPASFQMQQKLPVAAKDESSSYADEGSALHAAMADILNNDLAADDVLGKVYAPFTDYPITQDLIDEAITPCLDFFDKLDEELGGIEYRIECRVAVKSIAGIFGTADLIGRAAQSSVIADWKFGQGVMVLAWYEDDDGEVVPNEQPMLYLLAATETYPEMFDVDNPNWPIERIASRRRCASPFP